MNRLGFEYVKGKLKSGGPKQEFFVSGISGKLVEEYSNGFSKYVAAMDPDKLFTVFDRVTSTNRTICCRFFICQVDDKANEILGDRCGYIRGRFRILKRGTTTRSAIGLFLAWKNCPAEERPTAFCTKKRGRPPLTEKQKADSVRKREKPSLTEEQKADRKLKLRQYNTEWQRRKRLKLRVGFESGDVTRNLPTTCACGKRLHGKYRESGACSNCGKKALSLRSDSEPNRD